MPAVAPKAERRCGDCGRPFVGGPYAKTGPCCRWKHRGRTVKKYAWTPERDQVLRDRYDPKTRGAIAALALVIGWPAWVLKKRATTLGLTHSGERKDWTPEETAFLWEHTGVRHSHWIAKQLGRPEASVVMKCKHLKISRRVQGGYTLRELTLCFGVDHHVIERWVREGKLLSRGPGRPTSDVDVRRRGTDRPHDAWAVSDADILRFVIEHPMAFRLDKVDQVWFMDLVTSGGLLRKALADEQALETV